MSSPTDSPITASPAPAVPRPGADAPAPSGPSQLSLPADFDARPKKEQLAIQRKIDKEQKKHDKRAQQHKAAEEAQKGNGVAAGRGGAGAGAGGGPLRFKPREWSRVKDAGEGEGRFTILSWNVSVICCHLKGG